LTRELVFSSFLFHFADFFLFSSFHSSNLLLFKDDELIKASRHGTQAVNASYGESGLTPVQKRAQEGTIQMQQLKQLISSESAIPSQLMVVYETLTQITALSDLSKALDLLALSTRLTEIGATDSCFHSEVVLHTRDQLDNAMEDDVVVTSKNSHIEELSTKIDLHTQVSSLYRHDILENTRSHFRISS
jgi:hypothetical protein